MNTGGAADNLIVRSPPRLRHKAGDHATAVTHSEKAIAASPAAPESWHRLYMRSLQVGGPAEEKYDTVMEFGGGEVPEGRILAHPAGPRPERAEVFDDIYLDLYRALRESGSKLTEQERSKAADEALRRGLPGEALSLLESADARGEVKSEFDKKNLATARSQSKSDGGTGEGHQDRAGQGNCKGPGAQRRSAT